MMMNTRLQRCLVAILAALNGASASSTVVADLKLKSVDTVNGPRDFLRQSLLQSPEEARFLALAERQLSLGENELAFEALRMIFRQEHDSFTPVFPDKPTSSTYQAAFELLRQAGFTVRKNWAQSVESLATSALQQALQRQGSGAIMSVARQFPLSETGLQAMSLAALSAHSLGQPLAAQALVTEIEQTYGQLTLSFDATATINALRQQISSTARKSINADRPELAAQAVAVRPSELDLPWPVVKWRWEETLWNYGAMASVMGGISLQENSSLLPISNWRPAILQDSIVFRTPARVISFDKMTGAIKWQLSTDTYDKPQGEDQALNERTLVSRTSLSRLLQMDQFGTVTATQTAVYFVDHFRTFMTRSRARGPLKDEFPTMSAEGARLVCVSLNPEPHVAWTIGDADGFAYEVLGLGDSSIRFDPHHANNLQDDSENSDESVAATAPFSGEHFLGPPLVHDETLFVLSADRDVAWLNCLTQSRGRLLWRKPLAYHSATDAAAGGQFLGADESRVGASLCGVDKDVLLSVLKNGVVIGTRLTDGQLLWVTNFREEVANPGSRLSRSYRGRLLNGRSGDFKPQLTPGRMVWAAPDSNVIRCIDTRTGRIVWTSPRTAIGAGSLEGSTDGYAVMSDDTRVVLAGTQHLRALSIDDGSQLWIAETHRQSGRAFANRSTCLVPQLNGAVLAFDVTDGHRIAASGDFKFSADMMLRGSIFADEHVFCVATPLSMEVRPTKSHLLKQQRPVNAATSSDVQLDAARLQLLSGDDDAAVRVLVELLNSADTDPDQRRASENLLAETLLRAMSKTRLAAQDTAGPSVDTALLTSLSLNQQQQWQYQLLSPNRLVMPGSVGGREPLLVQLTPDWTVRSDVAASSLLAPDVTQQIQGPVKPRLKRRLDIEQAILFPDRHGKTQDCRDVATQLVHENRRVAAELLLLKARARANDVQAASINTALTRLRGSRSTLQSQPPLSASGLTFRFHHSAKVATDRLAQLVDVSKDIIDTPDWYSQRLFMIGRNFHTVDMQTGAVSVPRPIPVSMEAAAMPWSKSQSSLVPLVGTQHIGMMSLTAGPHPDLLWQKRITTDAADFSRVEVGPVGSDFAIFANRSEVTCLHPLTGSILWRQRLTSAIPARNQFRPTDWLVGDQRVVGVMGIRSESCTLLRTGDGKRLKVLPLDIPSGQRPLVSGRMLLYQFERRLRLIDLESGKDILWNRPPIEVLRNGPATLLSHHRAAFLNSEGALCLLDMSSGEILLTAKLGESFLELPLVGINVIERGDQLFLMAKDYGNTDRQYSASSRMEDPILASGTLYCIDASTGKLRWKRPATSSVMPQIYGDPADLMLLWWWHDTNDYTQRRLGGLGRRRLDTERSLEMELIDSRSGEIVAAAKQFGKQEPLRCVHDADRKVIEIHTDVSTITVTYEAHPDKANSRLP